MATRLIRSFSFSLIAFVATAVSSVIPTADAAFVQPQSWTRGAGGTTYQHWNAFDAYPTDNTPDVGNVNPNGTASLTETTGAGFLTSGGNIYSFAAATAFTVTIPEADVAVPPHNVTAIVQFKTQGSELDAGSVPVLLNGLSPADSAELSRLPLGGMGGSLVERWFLFEIPYASFGDGNPADGDPDVANLTLAFSAASSSMSLDEVSIDTAIMPFGFFAEANPVPEPAAFGLLGAAGLAVLRRPRRRRHS